MDEQYEVYWNEMMVGYMVLLQPDMWYYDAVFTPNEMEEATAFVSSVQALDVREIIRDPTKGVAIVLRSGHDPSVNMHFWLMGIIDNIYSMRRVFSHVIPSSEGAFPAVKPWWKFWS